MSNFHRCPTCQALLWHRDTNHVCPPAWECYDTDQDPEGDDPRTVYAADAEDAATEYCEAVDDDNSEYATEERTVNVRAAGSLDEWQAFRVTMEWVRSYSASEVE